MVFFEIGENNLYAFDAEGLKYVMEEVKEYPIMQYTGLKDKNGKEIWEGDILYDPSRDEKWQVKWISEDDGYDRSGWAMEETYSQNRHRAKVIGNIYQNPELL